MDDIEKLSCHHLMGTKMLKPYLNGFLMNVKMYNKLKEINDPFAYEKFR